MRERFKVRITTGRAWYETMVGEIVEVVEFGNDYVVASDFDRGHQATWFHIERSDAERVDHE